MDDIRSIMPPLHITTVSVEICARRHLLDDKRTDAVYRFDSKLSHSATHVVSDERQTHHLTLIIV